MNIPIHHCNKAIDHFTAAAYVKTLINFYVKANLGAVPNSPKSCAMTYELDYYQQILSAITSDIQDNLEEENLFDDIKLEALRIKQRIDCYSPSDTHDQKANIHYQLGCLSRFSIIVEAARSTAANREKLSTLNLLIENTEDIVNHILQHYPNEFDFRIRVTRYRVQNYIKNSGDKINLLTNALQSNQINSSIQEIIKTIISPNPDHNLTFQQLTYTQYFLREISQPTISDPSDWQITKILIAHNYNARQFGIYLINLLKTKQSEATSITEQYRILIQLKKDLAQIIQHNNPPYFPDLPDIKETLLNTIQSELDFMKEIDFLNAELINSGLLESTYKIGISVKQLGFLIYLCMDCGIITEKKAKSVHQYIISHVTTKEKEQISEKSFSNGYYVHLPEDIRKISELLAKMLALAQKLY
ncbi:hypothetical protein [Pedobacter frigidisoli]|uniref:hypothetical protein n=1 Tax=Pedobacter frigidisoli TaxID=2530455 RepID=UPI0029309B01|nr:hypothetical protein [Pedobacter frigidisoli]